MNTFANQIKDLLIHSNMDYEVSSIDENSCQVLVINEVNKW